MENSIMEKMFIIWIFKRPITKDERKWLVFLKGINGFQKIMKDLQEYQVKYKKMKSNYEFQQQITKEISQLDKRIVKDFRGIKRDYLPEIEKYNFPYEKFIDILYPNIVQGYKFT